MHRHKLCCYGILFLLLAGCPHDLPELKWLALRHLEQINPRVSTKPVSRYGSHYPEVGSGHNWITAKAFEHLNQRGLQPAQLSSLEWLVQYGVSFADEPWLGRPESPYSIAVNHMTGTIGNFEYCLDPGPQLPPETQLPALPTGSSNEPRCHKWTCAVPRNSADPWKFQETGYTQDSALITNILAKDVTVDVSATIFWMSGCAGRRMANVTPYFEMQLAVNGSTFPGLPLTALDNMFHFPYRDLQFITPNNDHQYDLRLQVTLDDIFGQFESSVNSGLEGAFPPLFWVYNIFGWNTDSAKKGAQALIAALGGDRIVKGSQYGSITYGAILYQLSRKFFTGSRAEPRLEELVKAPEVLQVAGEPPLTGLKLSFPTTYLGGMPFICAKPSSGDARKQYSDKDPCQYGDKTWPIWVPLHYYENQTTDFLKELLRDKPGRSDRAAAIYLGWAAHMMQDNALPYHATNWQGLEHVRQEQFNINGYKKSGTGYIVASIAAMDEVVLCNGRAATIRRKPDSSGSWVVECNDPTTITMDAYFDQEISRRFGNRKTREEICKAEGFFDEQIKEDALHYEDVRGPFVASAQRSYQARYAPPPHGLERVRDAVVSTMVLLMCAPPLKPATPTKCSEGSLRCDRDQALRCQSDGSEEKVQDCDRVSKSHCSAGKCILDLCSERYSCQGDTAYRCIDGKLTNSEFCSDYGGRCVAGVCRLCESGAFRCIGNSAETCETDGRWHNSPSCSNDGLKCRDGKCVDPCTQGYKCASGVAKHCVGGIWQDSNSCSADGRKCIGNACIGCPSGSTFCESTKKCHPNGSGPCAPECGPGELFCTRTNKCYAKTRPDLCWECSSDRECGPSATCFEHQCMYQ